MMYNIINFSTHNDYEGCLVALEKGEDFYFEVKRVYYIWGTKPNIIRGKHAHHKLEQLIVCLSGSCDFFLDNGEKQVKIHLDDPTKGLYIKHDIWREFTNFSKDCVVMVLASEHYDEADYIRDYKEFKKKVNQGKNS